MQEICSGCLETDINLHNLKMISNTTETKQLIHMYQAITNLKVINYI